MRNKKFATWQIFPTKKKNEYVYIYGRKFGTSKEQTVAEEMNLKECARKKANHFAAVLTIASYLICSILRADANVAPLVCLDRSETLHQATGVVSKWLNHTVNQQSSDNRPNFLIQGWRWHTLSLIRDLDRLRLFSESISSDISTESIREEDMKQFKSASDFVIDFNMGALYRIEEKTFFPWLQKKVLAPCMSRNIPDAESVKEFQQAFGVILEYLAQERNKIKYLGQTLVSWNPVIINLMFRASLALLMTLQNFF
jgi:hypothetical protein